MLTDAIYRATKWAPAWCHDLCHDYNVVPSEALQLGIRANGRRPTLPGSATCQPVSGKTWEELWNAHSRDTQEGVFSFWEEIGAWAAFRQAVRHRGRSFRFVAAHLPRGVDILEYGAGIAPVAWWLVRHGVSIRQLTLVDVPSEHFRFGVRRLGRLRPHVEVIQIQPGKPPLERQWDAACVLEVLEHCPAPLETIRHITEHLRHHSLLWEDFGPHPDASGPDLPAAQQERPQVYAYLDQRYRLEAGRPWMEADGGGIRRWRKK